MTVSFIRAFSCSKSLLLTPFPDSRMSVFSSIEAREKDLERSVALSI